MYGTRLQAALTGFQELLAPSERTQLQTYTVYHSCAFCIWFEPVKTVPHNLTCQENVGVSAQ